MREIEKRLFLTLCRDGKWHHYFVLNDLNYVDDFWADTDYEALMIFRSEYCGKS